MYGGSNFRRNPNFPDLRRGMGESQLADFNATQQAINALSQNTMERQARIDFLLKYGDPFFLPLALDIGTTPAANTPFTRSTPNLDFDVLIVGLKSDLRLSKVQIKDSSRQRDLVNSAVPIWLLATWFSATASYTNSCEESWVAPYWLAPRCQLTCTILADGTESNGNFNFVCLMPPSTSV